MYHLQQCSNQNFIMLIMGWVFSEFSFKNLNTYSFENLQYTTQIEIFFNMKQNNDFTSETEMFPNTECFILH